MNGVERKIAPLHASLQQLAAAPPGRHQREHHASPSTSGNQPPSHDLDDVRAEERQVDDEEAAGRRDATATTGQRHMPSRTTMKASIVVISIVPVTAMP